MTRCQSASSISSVGLFFVMPATSEKNVDSAEGLDAHVAQALERAHVRDVGGDRQRAAAVRLDLGGDVLHELDAAAGRHHICAGLCQTERQRAADPAGTTNDDGRRPDRSNSLMNMVRPTMAGAGCAHGAGEPSARPWPAG